MRPVTRNRESGFALLLVFLMSAVIAIMLYNQLPRAAFEAQRAKEEMLQERGEQYIRAIQLYVAAWRRYPENLDALEKTNNRRFLRRRYKDPMTGKDEWRVIHINAAGQLTDSLIQKAPAEKKENLNNFITEMPAIGATANPGDAAQSAALRRRPSDQQGMPMPGASGNVPVDPQVQPNGMPVGNTAVGQDGQPVVQGQNGQPGEVGQQPFDPTQPGQQQQPGQFDPNQTGQQQPQPGQVPPGQFPPGQIQPTQVQPVQFPTGQMQQGQMQPGQMQPGQMQPGQMQPGQMQQGQMQQGQMQQGQMQQGQMQQGQMQQGQMQQGQMQQQFNQGMPYPVPVAPGVSTGSPTSPGTYPVAPGAQPGRPGGANQGLDMINKILTTPRGANSGMGVPGAPGLQIGGGIAGFASIKEAPSIKVYNERQKYNEWEFIYDMKKDKRILGAAAAGTNPNQQQQNQLGGSTLGNTSMPNPMMNNSGSTMSPGFGANSSPGFGNNSSPGFGNNSNTNPNTNQNNNRNPTIGTPPRGGFNQGGR